MEFITPSELWQHLIRNEDQDVWDQNNLTEVQKNAKRSSYELKYKGKRFQIEAPIYDIECNAVGSDPGIIYIKIKDVIVAIKNKKVTSTPWNEVTLNFYFDKSLLEKMIVYSKGEFVKIVGEIQKTWNSGQVFLNLISIDKIIFSSQ